KFIVKKIMNGSELINAKELGTFSKSSNLVKNGITNFFIDTETNVSEVVSFYRNILDGNKTDDSNLKKDYILAWSYRGVS
ncbi:MAG: hypothetical protein ABIJ08_01825, partial [Nanoarchaeota archaeon]